MIITNFFKNLSHGLLEFVRPVELVERAITATKIVGNTIAGASKGLTSKVAGSNIFRSSYNTATVPLSAVTAATAVLGVDSVIYGSTIGDTKITGFSYFVSGLPKDIVAIGKTPDSALLLLYQDFRPHGRGYLFRVDPRGYGTVTSTSDSSEPALSFFYVGGELTAKHQPLTKGTFGTSGNTDVISAIKTATSSSFSTGISSAPLAASTGTYPYVKDTRVIGEWREGGYTVLVTDTGVVRCADNATIESSLSSNTKERMCSTVVRDDILIIPCEGKFYFISGNSIPPQQLPDNILEEYKYYINKNNDDYDTLRVGLEALGVKTIDVTHGSNNLTPGELSILSRYIPGAGSIHPITHVRVRVHGQGGVTASRVNKVLVHFSNLAVDANIAKTASGVCGNINSLLSHSVGSGCFVCETMLKDDKAICLTTSGCDIIGARPLPSSKIYAISLIMGGNTDDSSVEYTQQQVNPISLGVGLSLGATITIE